MSAAPVADRQKPSDFAGRYRAGVLETRVREPVLHLPELPSIAESAGFWHRTPVSWCQKYHNFAINCDIFVSVTK